MQKIQAPALGDYCCVLIYSSDCDCAHLCHTAVRSVPLMHAGMKEEQKVDMSHN